MNIFATHADPTRSAVALADRHVIKMTLESAQMASTIVRLEAEDYVPGPLLAGLYRKTHAHHPSTVWAGATRANFHWLLDHGLALGAEYTRRFGKVHKSAAVLESIKAEWADVAGTDDTLTPFAQAMPQEFKSERDSRAAYRYYLRWKYADWRAAGRPPRWTKATPPHWAPQVDTLD